MAEIILAAGREKSLLRRHPWVYSGALASVPPGLEPGAPVTLRSASGAFLAYGIYNPRSQIAVRALSFDERLPADGDLVRRRISRAALRRASLRARGCSGLRLVASEGDCLPGLTVDQYNEFLVLAISSRAMEVYRDDIIGALDALYPGAPLYERSDSRTRLKEGLEIRRGVVRGPEPPSALYFRENGLVCLPADIPNGHKTGAYLDQRSGRLYACALAGGARVLNCFSYTGGFGLWALKGGARSVDNVDVSEPALRAARDAVVFNHLDPGRCRFIRADVFDFLRRRVQEGALYDLVILDPPKFADSAASLRRACRGYQDINRLAFRLVADGGHLLTFSCSGLVGPELFQKITADAALEAGVQGTVAAALRQDSDHPVSLPCPETFYLKGLDIIVDRGD